MQHLTRLVPEATLLAGSRPAAREKLEAIDELLGLVYTPAGIVHFLTTPAGVFGGETALALIVRGDYDNVLSELATDYNGDGA